ncbi:hypothetical protein JCM10207_002860 [Rhodosporidiobolus poonsookiae]
MPRQSPPEEGEVSSSSSQPSTSSSSVPLRNPSASSSSNSGTTLSVLGAAGGSKAAGTGTAAAKSAAPGAVGARPKLKMTLAGAAKTAHGSTATAGAARPNPLSALAAKPSPKSTPKPLAAPPPPPGFGDAAPSSGSREGIKIAGAALAAAAKTGTPEPTHSHPPRPPAHLPARPPPPPPPAASGSLFAHNQPPAFSTSASSSSAAPAAAPAPQPEPTDDARALEALKRDGLAPSTSASTSSLSKPRDPSASPPSAPQKVMGWDYMGSAPVLASQGGGAGRPEQHALERGYGARGGEGRWGHGGYEQEQRRDHDRRREEYGGGRDRYDDGGYGGYSGGGSRGGGYDSYHHQGNGGAAPMPRRSPSPYYRRDERNYNNRSRHDDERYHPRSPPRHRSSPREYSNKRRRSSDAYDDHRRRRHHHEDDNDDEEELPYDGAPIRSPRERRRSPSRTPLSGSPSRSRSRSRSRSPGPQRRYLDQGSEQRIQERMQHHHPRPAAQNGRTVVPPSAGLPARPPVPGPSASDPSADPDALARPSAGFAPRRAMPAPPPPPPAYGAARPSYTDAPPPPPDQQRLGAPYHAANPASFPSNHGGGGASSSTGTGTDALLARSAPGAEGNDSRSSAQMSISPAVETPSAGTPLPSVDAAAEPEKAAAAAHERDQPPPRPPKVRTRRAAEDLWVRQPTEDELAGWFGEAVQLGTVSREEVAAASSSAAPTPTAAAAAELDAQLASRRYLGSSHIREYTLQEKLGEGTFGVVWKGVRGAVDQPSAPGALSVLPAGFGVERDQREVREEEELVKRGLRVRKGDKVALKQIIFHNEGDGLPITSVREIRILKMLDHPNVVPVVDMAIEPANPLEFKLGKTYMVFPYMDHDLAGLLENPRVKLEPAHIKQYGKQLLEGTAYMHRNGILHRDMKAANLLISNKGQLMIADFGLARSVEKASADQKYTACVVTRWYRPPELLLGERKYHNPIDMWGVGCVLAEMYHRAPIFPGQSDMDQAARIFALCGPPTQESMPGWRDLPGVEGFEKAEWGGGGRSVKAEWERRSNDAVFGDLIDKILVLDPKKRLTAEEALDHDWFWSEPYPADPSRMPQYNASHEYDRRLRHESGASGPPSLPPPQPLPGPLTYFMPGQNPHAMMPPPPPPPMGMDYPAPVGAFNGPPPPGLAGNFANGHGPPGGFPPAPQPYQHGPGPQGFGGGGPGPQQSYAARGMGPSVNRHATLGGGAYPSSGPSWNTGRGGPPPQQGGPGKSKVNLFSKMGRK